MKKYQIFKIEFIPATNTKPRRLKISNNISKIFLDISSSLNFKEIDEIIEIFFKSNNLKIVGYDVIKNDYIVITEFENHQYFDLKEVKL